VTETTTVDAAANVAMTDASLAAIDADLVPDAFIASLVRLTDQQLNATLGPFFRQAFPDYDPAKIGTGIYHPVGVTAQNMMSNGTNPGPAVLSGANLPGLLANRIDAAPATGGIQELKEWMALLSYVGTGSAGRSPASTPRRRTSRSSRASAPLSALATLATRSPASRG
jgi:hypothetical protein